MEMFALMLRKVFMCVYAIDSSSFNSILPNKPRSVPLKTPIGRAGQDGHGKTERPTGFAIDCYYLSMPLEIRPLLHLVMSV